VDCGYKIPSRKGRRTTGERESSQPITNVPSSSSTNTHDETTKHLSSQQVLDMYYGLMCGFAPLKAIERIDLEHYLANAETEPSQDLNAMMFSIRALCEQRVGMMETAEESMELARKALAPIFFENMNYYVISTFVFLALYESGCGRLKTTRYYLTFVKNYIEEFSKETAPEKYEELRKLRRVLGVVELSTASDNDILSDLKRWPSSFEKYIGMPLPDELYQLLSQDVTPHNYKAFLKFVEVMGQLAQNLIKLTDAEVRLHDFIFPLFMNGLRLEVLKKSGNEQLLMEECATMITNSTEHELFPFCPPIVVAFVASAARVHLGIVKAIERGERRNPERCLLTTHDGETIPITVDYYTILQKDQRALNVLNKKYKKVALFHGDLLEEMTTIVHQRLLNQLGELQGVLRLH